MEVSYAREYEEAINPFAAFQRREKAARVAALSPVEKLLLSASSAVLTHRRARIVFFGYMVSR